MSDELERADFIGTDPERVCFWDRDEVYAGGDLIITGARIVRDVPVTANIVSAERAGDIKRVTPEVEEEEIALTTIKGIGDATAAELTKMGVHTVQDLAAVDVANLSDDMAEAFPADKLEPWVKAAKAAITPESE